MDLEAVEHADTLRTLAVADSTHRIKGNPSIVLTLMPQKLILMCSPTPITINLLTRALMAQSLSPHIRLNVTTDMLLLPVCAVTARCEEVKEMLSEAEANRAVSNVVLNRLALAREERPNNPGSRRDRPLPSSLNNPSNPGSPSSRGSRSSENNVDKRDSSPGTRNLLNKCLLWVFLPWRSICLPQ